MQQPCSKCGYVSDRPARFCRNCGVPLFVENETTTATTRNYGGQQGPDTNPNRPYTSQNYAPKESPYGGYSDQTPNTDRFYRPPAVPEYGGPPKKKSSAKTWLIVAFILLLTIGGGLSILTYTFFRVRDRVRIPTEEVVTDIGAQIQEQIQEQIRQAEERARQAEERARQAQENLPVIEGVPPAPPAPPAPGAAAPLTLEKYRYPKADVQRSTSFIGNEFLQMTTADNVATVSEFYNKLIGQAAVKTNDADGEKVVYQVQGSPSTLVVISPDEDSPGKTQIAVFRSKINIPRLNIKIN